MYEIDNFGMAPVEPTNIFSDKKCIFWRRKSSHSTYIFNEEATFVITLQEHCKEPIVIWKKELGIIRKKIAMGKILSIKRPIIHVFPSLVAKFGI